MDYVVHINDGSSEVSPIVLRLLPGEETIFNLKVVNHGEPSNISLEASDPLLKAVRLKKPDHYVVMEENIPIVARMPKRSKRLDGEILLTSSMGSSSVPVSLVSESEDPGDSGGSADMERLVDEDPSDDLDGKEGDGDGGEEEDEARGYKDEDVDGTGDGTGEEAESIRFSRQKDLQSYRAASRSRRRADFGDSRGYKRSYDQNHDQGHDQSYGQGNNQSYSQSYDQSYDQINDRSQGQIPYLSQEEGNERTEEDSKDELRDRILTMRLDRESIQVVPAIILLSLIFALVLTFYTESIPEYPGALASSILIATLIIYGAATLLKA